MIDEMRGPFRHPPATAARTKATPLTREGDQLIVATRVAVKPRESRRQAAASEKVPEFPLDEPRQAFPVA